MADALERLLALRALPERRIVGLMSGTSGDGVDAALCAISGAGEATRVRLLAFETLAFDAPTRQLIWSLPDAAAADLAAANMLLGEAFARAVLAVIARAQLRPEDVHLCGSHGQTARHDPGRATLQLAEAAVIAERTGLPVICDFRVRDVAAGGHGAPLLPLVDYLLFCVPGRVRAIQNLGGIASVTVMGDRPETIFGFDIGPCNMVLDAIARAASGGAALCDRDGAGAGRGRIDDALVAELLSHPFLAEPLPRTTGREAFGRDFVYPLLARFEGRFDDLLASMTYFIAQTIAQAYVRLIAPRTRLDELILAGGGVHNRTLVAHLRALLAPLPVRMLDELGMDPDAREAVAFGVLANETLHGRAGNVPAATGARGPRVLGKIVLP